MKIKLYILLSFLFTTTSPYSQNKKACDTKFHKQFDFWVGDWIVYDTVGNKVGENLIHKIEDDCIINEHWKSVRGGSGSSYNYFDKTDSTWNQLWIDNQGNNLILKGKASEGKMSMRSKLLSTSFIGIYRRR